MNRSYPSRYLCWLLAPFICAAPAASAAVDPASAVAPFVDAQTVLVVRLDLAKFMPAVLINLIVAMEEASEGSAEVEEPTDSGAALLATIIDTWTDAGGGAIYMVVTLADDWPAPVFFVAPLEAGHDIEAIEALWRKVGPRDVFRLEMIRGAAVAATPDTLERLGTHAPVDLPELRPAFKAVSTAGLQVVVRISDDMRRVIAELEPQLPEELGGGPSTLITEQLQWAAAGADIFPNVAVKLHFQANSLEAAAALGRGAEALLAAVGEYKGGEAQRGNRGRLPRAIAPRVEGNALVVDIDRDHVMRWFNELLPTLQRVRTAARRTLSLTQMRGLHMACLLYAGKKQNRGKFPPDLATVVQGGDVLPQSLLSPFAQRSLPHDFDGWHDDRQRRWLNANASYVLLPGLTSDVDTRIALIENLQFSQDQQVLIAYQDGTAESRPYHAAQQAIVEQTGKTLEEWSRLLAPKMP